MEEPKKKDSILAIAHKYTGSMVCSCGTEMTLKERILWESQKMESYFQCEGCGKHTKVMTFSADDPIAVIMTEMKKVKNAIGGKTHESTETECIDSRTAAVDVL